MNRIAVEIFSCAGGMAEGFRRAGIEFDLMVDKDPDAVASYEQNLGTRPVQMDASDLLRMLELGVQLPPVRLLVADPPCTPWSRAGKRKGTDDNRDMLVETCRLIGLVRPRCWLLGNVPGLDDGPNWHIVQQHIGSIPGYCVDYFKLDAADYGVPQRRIRPFWFGHPFGTPCLRPPAPTHGDPASLGHPELGDHRKPWRTCRDALQHLPLAELGKPSRMRTRKSNSKQHGSVADRPARGVGTSNLSDDNVLSSPGPKRASPRPFHNGHPPSEPDMPARTITISDAGCEHSGPLTLFVPEQPKNLRNPPFSRPPSTPDSPATTITTRGDRTEGANGAVLFLGHERNDPNCVVLSEKAGALLQGFPEGWVFAGRTKKSRWSMIGQAMPPALAAAVAREIAKWLAE